MLFWGDFIVVKDRNIYKQKFSACIMVLKLNTTREVYREFYGKGADQMAKLITDNRVPMNVAQLMQKRLEVRNSEPNIKNSYIDKFFDTGDIVVYNPYGEKRYGSYSMDHRDGSYSWTEKKIKIVHDSPLSRKLILQSLKTGILDDEIYKSLLGEEFKESEIGILGYINSMSKKEAKAHPIWKFLARDQALLDDYVDYVFAERKLKGLPLMQISLPNLIYNNLELRVWRICGINNGDSDAIANELNSKYNYGFDDRFIGIDSKTLKCIE